MSDEYEDKIENFISSRGPIDPNGPNGPPGPNGPNGQLQQQQMKS